MGISSPLTLDAGNCLCRGSQQESASTPASDWSKVKVEYSAKAPPCENPPSTIRLAGMPADTSFRIKPCMLSRAAFMPASSSSPPISSVIRSNQEGMRNPEFNDTGCVGAVGQITFMKGGRMAAKALLQPCLQAKLSMNQLLERMNQK